MALAFAALHGTGDLDRAGEQQQAAFRSAWSYRRRVADDGEGCGGAGFLGRATKGF